MFVYGEPEELANIELIFLNKLNLKNIDISKYLKNIFIISRGQGAGIAQ